MGFGLVLGFPFSLLGPWPRTLEQVSALHGLATSEPSDAWKNFAGSVLQLRALVVFIEAGCGSWLEVDICFLGVCRGRLLFGDFVEIVIVWQSIILGAKFHLIQAFKV